jgi:hypothetical protein
MKFHWSEIPGEVLAVLRDGAVIPAHPLALDASRRLDRRRQCGLSRYYVDAGAGGLAVGVHTTQFAIREVGLYEPVLRIAAEAVRCWTKKPFAMIAGLCGGTKQACEEAVVARALGYHAGLLSLAGMKGASQEELIEHCATVAREMPLVGFYLQPAVGGIALGHRFWARFATIENVIAIKVAPFDRYGTLDVIRGVVTASAEDRIVLYTGNDDHIVLDLVTPFIVERAGQRVVVRFRGGLLGHWSVWVRSAVTILKRCKAQSSAAAHIDSDLLALDSRVTDCNSAFFDTANNFKGCIAGCHEILRRQGLLEGIWCLDPAEGLSPGQAAEIDRVCREHSDLSDDEFVKENLQRWLD